MPWAKLFRACGARFLGVRTPLPILAVRTPLPILAVPHSPAESQSLVLTKTPKARRFYR